MGRVAVVEQGVQEGQKDWLLPLILNGSGEFAWAIRKADRWIRANYEVVREVKRHSKCVVVKCESGGKRYSIRFDNSPEK